MQITTDGKKNAVINGITDWVYEENLLCKAFDWSADSKNWLSMKAKCQSFRCLCFIKIYILQLRLLNIQRLEKNAVVSLHLFDVNTNTAKKLI
jgi:dipeptidyl-peptidase-4